MQQTPSHGVNVDREEKKKQEQGGTRSGMPSYTIITPEEELYARTIRTVHAIVIRQLSLNDMIPLPAPAAECQRDGGFL